MRFVHLSVALWTCELSITLLLIVDALAFVLLIMEFDAFSDVVVELVMVRFIPVVSLTVAFL